MAIIKDWGESKETKEFVNKSIYSSTKTHFRKFLKRAKPTTIKEIAK